MSIKEKQAREYCASIHTDPDEIVWGYFGHGEWISAPRWSWYQF